MAIDVKRPTMRDIAQLAGVPVSAVALALADKPGVSPSRRAAILRSAADLGYDRVDAAETPIFGLVMEQTSPAALADGFGETLIQGVYSGAHELDAQVVLSLYRPGSDPIAELQSLASRPLSGLIVANGGDLTTDVIDRLASTSLPLVLIENRIGDGISSVSSDNVQAGLESTRHLIELGHRRIGLIEGSARYVSLRDRSRGHFLALHEAGLAIDPDLVRPEESHVSRKGYKQAMDLLGLADPPTAIYAVSDRSALGAIDAITDLGLTPGRDISVVGTDNLERAAPLLTTFDTMPRQLGPVAIRQLATLRQGFQTVTHTTVEGHLVIRESSRPAKDAQ